MAMFQAVAVLPTMNIQQLVSRYVKRCDASDIPILAELR
jgi:hypothetical protein